MMSGPATRRLKDENARLREAKARLVRLVRACQDLRPMFEYSENLSREYEAEIRQFELAVAAAGEIVSSTTPSASSTKRHDD